MTLHAAIKSKSISEIRRITRTTPVADIADTLETLEPTERILFFRLLNTETQSKIFSELEPEFQEHLIQSFTDEQMKEIVGDLYTDEIADLVEDMPIELVQRILKATDKETRSLINKILRYSDDQTGSIMNVDLIPIKQSWTVSQAINIIKEEKSDARMTHYFFVVDSKKKLVGYIAIEDLLFSQRTAKISTLSKPVASVQTTTDKEEAALVFKNHGMSVLPVINSQKELIGMITSDQAIEIVSEELTEDIERMAGIENIDDVSYSKSTTWNIFKSRTLWLLLLMISATLSQIVLDSFQSIASNLTSTIIATTAIVAIVPVISGAAGNAGSQSSTTIIRALATNDIKSKDYFKVFWKELRASIIIGMLLGIANFVRLVIYYATKPGVSLNSEYLILSMAASISLLVVIMLAKIVGGTLPLIAKTFKLDPAVMAAPLLTTLIDALSTLIFFGVSIGILVSIF